MTQNREIQIALRQGCQVSEIIRMAIKPRPSYAARRFADELEAFFLQQEAEGERQEWTHSFKDRVIALVERWWAR